METTKKIVTYIGWALLQHVFVITVTIAICKIFVLGVESLAPIGIGIFSIVHFPNLLLMILTFLFSSVFYPLLFDSMYFDLLNLVMASLLMLLTHALVGTALNVFGVDMRTTFSFPKYSLKNIANGTVLSAIIITILVLLTSC